MSESGPCRGALIFRCFDLETTSVDVETCEVVQAAVVSAPHCERGVDLHRVESHSQLFAARDVPPESTAVHRITDRNPERFAFPTTVIPADAPPFAACALSMTRALTEPSVVAVSFNGVGYDIPIVARFVAAAGGLADPDGSTWRTRAEIEAHLRSLHIDVMRLWVRVRQGKRAVAWCDNGFRHKPPTPLTADMFAGSLTAAHGFWLGEGFDSAHDAANDCRATLAVLDAMLRSGFADVETAIRWSNEPLPGDVDFDGKFKWQGDQVVIGFGKHNGTPLERLPASYLRWMLDSDFPASTKHVVRRFLAGEYPARAYEAE